MCYPVKLLEVEKFNTKETILIKRYLLVRIETMKNARNNVSAKKIIYDRIDTVSYTHLTLPTTERV